MLDLTGEGKGVQVIGGMLGLIRILFIKLNNFLTPSFPILSLVSLAAALARQGRLYGLLAL